MGAGLFVSLFVTTVLAAGLVGQIGPGGRAGVPAWTSSSWPWAAARPWGLGVIMGFVFKADDAGRTDDDRAMEAAAATRTGPRPGPGHAAPVGPRPQFRLRHDRDRHAASGRADHHRRAVAGGPRGRWAWLAPAFLVARVRADRSGLRVFAGGLPAGHGRPRRGHRRSERRRTSRPPTTAAGATGATARTTALLVSSGPAVVVGPLRRAATGASAAAAPRRRTTWRRCSPGSPAARARRRPAGARRVTTAEPLKSPGDRGRPASGALVGWNSPRPARQPPCRTALRQLNGYAVTLP